MREVRRPHEVAEPANRSAGMREVRRPHEVAEPENRSAYVAD
ncbi:MAG: hypothetical protein ACOY5B_01660 [Spirochaetota bacterium]